MIPTLTHGPSGVSGIKAFQLHLRVFHHHKLFILPRAHTGVDYPAAESYLAGIFVFATYILTRY